jgi:nicotinate-nucleotide adenylyltransferase
MTEPLKHILLFPGAFNPPHLGHLAALESAVRELYCDEIWIMPSGNHPDKEIGISYEDRRAMGELFVAEIEERLDIPTRLITTELDDSAGRPTAEIMRELKSQTGIELTQLIGADGYEALGEVGRADERFIVMPRSGYELPTLEDDSETIIIEGTESNISSTRIRELVAAGDKAYEELLPYAIAEYITQHKLYG